MLTQAQYDALKTWPDGVACGHPGCLNHLTHPCEKCGRISGQSACSEAIREYQVKNEAPNAFTDATAT